MDRSHDESDCSQITKTIVVFEDTHGRVSTTLLKITLTFDRGFYKTPPVWLSQDSVMHPLGYQ